MSRKRNVEGLLQADDDDDEESKVYVSYYLAEASSQNEKSEWNFTDTIELLRSRNNNHMFTNAYNFNYTANAKLTKA
ncbi:hypothetical protein MSG28_007810 [Choristoneura fumiferana]|uniref:Uncharacterized protein n=1 Tax=Choristoneura fumiferana TaxID=7141 RepID=A0ACC0JYW9_CHOFU|nr:hypothetical protein MSG28_007810 [Choristoneura fumiferana]